MNGKQFAKETIFNVLREMNSARHKGKSKDYRTLSNTLKEAMEVLNNTELEDNDIIFVKIVSRVLIDEIESLTYTTSKAIRKDVREHHDWVLAYRKINDQLNIFKEVLKNDAVYNLECFFSKIQVVVSVTKENARELFLDNFRKNNKEQFIDFGDSITIGENKIIFTDYKNIPNISGYCQFHIDRKIGLYNYIAYVDGKIKSYASQLIN